MRYINIKRQPIRGARWENGSARMCGQCQVDVSYQRRGRARQAVVTATLLNAKYRLPVAYCHDHIPEQLIEEKVEQDIEDHETFLASAGADHLYPHGTG